VKTVTVSEARKLFAQVLEAVVKDDAPIVIVRYRSPIAAIVPMSRLSAAERSAADARLRSGQRRARRA
jgi:prevent-host-death family protein